MSRWIVAVSLSCIFATSAGADVPLPKGVQYVDPRVKFQGLDKHKDYVFYYRLMSFSGGPANVPTMVVELTHENEFKLGAQRRIGEFTLLAMKRDEFEKRVKRDGPPSPIEFSDGPKPAKASWFNAKTPGVLSASLETPSTIAKVGQPDPTTTYSVSIRDGKLSVSVAAKDRRRSEGGPVLPHLAAGLCLALGFTSLGLWWARRRPTI